MNNVRRKTRKGAQSKSILWSPHGIGSLYLVFYKYMKIFNENVKEITDECEVDFEKLYLLKPKRVHQNINIC